MAGAAVKKATEALVNSAQQASARSTEASVMTGGGPQVTMETVWGCGSE